MSQPILALVAELTELFETEAVRTQQEQLAFAALDTGMLLRRAEQRTAFDHEVARRVSALKRILPPPTARDDALTRALHKMRGAASALRVESANNHALLSRALSVVRGTVRALSPEAVPYGPRGRRARAYGTPAAAQSVRVARRG